MFTFPIGFSAYRDFLFDYVTLLIHGNGANNGTTITDVLGKTITNNGIITSTSQSYFNGSSIYWDGGSGHYLSFGNDIAFGLGTGAWTFEGFFNISDFSYFRDFFVINSSNFVADTPGFIDFNFTNSGKLNAWTGMDHNGNTILSANTWYHIAWVYDGSGTMKYYINGTLDATFTGLSFNFGSSNNATLGFSGTTTQFYKGYAAELRLTKYARTITVPTRPFPNI